jgi:hypothetical protein
MAKKKSDHNVLNGIASFTGHMVGSIEGAAGAAINAVHQLTAKQEEPSHEDVRFEESDISYRGALIGGACLLAGMWISVALLFLPFVYFKHQRAEASPPPLPVALHGDPLPPQPRLQNSPAQDLKTFRAKEDWELTHYYWLDRSKGRIAIPIEQAIQTLAKRGIPPQKTPPNVTLTSPEFGTALTGFEGKVEPEPR